jgi:hypothetical protein
MRSQSNNLLSGENCPWTDQYEFFPLTVPRPPLLTIPLGQSPPGNPLSNPNYGPVPGEPSLYNDYGGKAVSFPVNMSSPIAATTKGPRGPDDELF